jgi:hypothetical protein
MADPRGLSFRIDAALAAAALGAACLAGCARLPVREPDAAPAAVSYDFGPLLGAPFGTALQDVPVPLAEVLVFQEASDRGANERGDCFRPKRSAAFLGRPPTEYLLCFVHDRLRRIEASVVLPAAEAPALFAAACAEWRGRPQAPESDTCDGRRGEIAFSALRTPGPQASEATISITLTETSDS